MAVVAAVRSNPVIKNFDAQPRARGKYPKPSLTACMRKLLVILNAMLRRKISWQTPARAASTATLLPYWARFLNTVAATPRPISVVKKQRRAPWRLAKGNYRD
jgi:hypothetical protein